MRYWLEVHAKGESVWWGTDNAAKSFASRQEAENMGRSILGISVDGKYLDDWRVVEERVQ
jgi:hypothetical protein